MIPTAEEVLSKELNAQKTYPVSQGMINAMIEFAKLHVTEVLKLASYNIDLCVKDRSKFPEDGYSIDTSFVENCYPLTNIK